jgi:hypothetical protein
MRVLKFRKVITTIITAKKKIQIINCRKKERKNKKVLKVRKVRKLSIIKSIIAKKEKKVSL